MNEDNETKSRLTWQQVIAIAGFAVGVTTFASRLVTGEMPQWLAFGAELLLLASAIYLTRCWIIALAKRLHPHLVTTNPWLVAILLVLTALILYRISPTKKPVLIGFDIATSAVYNSWDHERSHNKHTIASGEAGTFSWHITDRGRSGSFQYQTDPALSPTTDASSGGYVTFYGRYCDRLQFRRVSFRCKATDATGAPDVGVRLAVDNPRATGDRELIAYQIASLKSFGTVDDTWRTFEIPLSSFSQVRYQPPFPAGLDENTINKLVFFVDTRIAASAARATLWFSDIRFEP